MGIITKELHPNVKLANILVKIVVHPQYALHAFLVHLQEQEVVVSVQMDIMVMAPHLNVSHVNIHVLIVLIYLLALHVSLVLQVNLFYYFINHKMQFFLFFIYFII